MKRLLPILLLACLSLAFDVAHPGCLERVKCVIEHESGYRCVFDLRPGHIESLPLVSGAGRYTVTVYTHLDGDRYRVLSRRTVHLDGESDFSASVQNVAWQETRAAEIAQEVTVECEADEDKLSAVESWVREHIEFCFIERPTTYLPDLDAVIETGEGNCYDLASLFAGMLRSVDIPCKLVTGYVGLLRVYHAWNEVWLDGEWHGHDLSCDISPETIARRAVRYVY